MLGINCICNNLISRILKGKPCYSLKYLYNFRNWNCATNNQVPLVTGYFLTFVLSVYLKSYLFFLFFIKENLWLFLEELDFSY